MRTLAPDRKGVATATPQTRNVRPSALLTINRSPDASSASRGADWMSLVDRARAGTSTHLDPAARQDMEPRFGYDFSQVRVHADTSAHVAARALDARAFAIGDHVFFGAGQYAPATGSGRRLLAHELAHVTQPASGETHAAAAMGFSVSEPGDTSERAAHASADRALAVTPPEAHSGRRATASCAAHPATIHRFLAGEAGHGGIEEEALQDAGFSKEQAHETYFGNWLRDFSQMPGSEDPSGAWLEFIKILATGEFGRAPTEQELGNYLASEHVDRPDGGDSPEAPGIDAAHLAKRRAAMSGSQRQWFDQEQTPAFQAMIAKASTASGLPEYIERAKQHVKQQLAEAAQLGRTQAGEHALGNGLHAVEDYFAHSNFIEVALAQLVGEHQLEADNPAVAAAKHYPGDIDPAKLGPDNRGRPKIVTGTSAPGPSHSVGLMEVMKAELKNSEIRAAFIKGASIRYGWNAPRAAGRAALGAVGGVIGGGLGAIGGAVGGLVVGAGKGAAAGWRGAHHWYTKPFAAIGGLFAGAFKGAGHGAKAGAEAGWRKGKSIGGAIGNVLGGAVGVALTPAVFAVIYPLYLLASIGGGVAGPLTEGAVNRRMEKKSLATIDPKGALNPTHSQIAKDDIEHPLHRAAARLAHDVDVAIGKVMIEVWMGKRPVSDAQRLIDIYMAHPKDGDWWRSTLSQAVKSIARK
jgi:hypothetical protein